MSDCLKNHYALSLIFGGIPVLSHRELIVDVFLKCILIMSEVTVTSTKLSMTVVCFGVTLIGTTVMLAPTCGPDNTGSA